MLGTRSNGRLL